MSTDMNNSFNEQYMNINTKMKKRFMRKPNVNEATNEFIALAIQSENSDQPMFAGHAYVGAAKCEASAGNYLGEAEHYLCAARQYMKAEKKLTALRFYLGDRENLEAAIGCYIQASHKYPGKSTIRTSILMELANDLFAMNRTLEAVHYYKQALENITNKAMKLMYLRDLLELMINCDLLDVALETANKIIDYDLEVPADILSEVEVTRVLLALVVKPCEDNKPESLKRLFSDLMNDNDFDAIPIYSDLRLKIQSIILSCATGDIQSLTDVAADVRHLFNDQQMELLHKLTREERLVHFTLN